ncbi:MAG: transglycosylase, partial [Methylophaga sp.]|nr:transglycosylase [Methylophaga sp.]
MNKHAMPLLSIAFLSCLYLLLPAISLAANNSQLSSQRLIFKQAQKALQTNQISQFKKLNAQLNDYPLHGYLDYLYLRHHLNYTDSQTITQFINTHKGSFYADRLHRSWLKRLIRGKKWPLFLAHYRETSSASQQCFRLQALISTGKGQQALNETAHLWLVPKSQDKACDPVFKYWQSKGQLTDELRWQRIILALEENQFNLAKYLAKSLSNPTPANKLIALWRRAHYSPLALLKQIPSKKGTLLSQDIAITRQIIQHSVQRLARKSTDKAFDAWQRIQPVYLFNEQDKLTTQRYIANRAALNREDRALEFFADIPAETWRVRAALWQQDWQAVQKAILDLNLNVQETPRWQYWLARSRAELGDQEAANQGYQSLLMDRDFYSFLAADKLQQPYQMNHKPLSIEQAELDSFSQQPAVARLKEFYALNMNLEARRQAYSLKQKSSVRQLQL